MKLLLITDLFPPDSGGRADKMYRHVKYAQKYGAHMDVLCPASTAAPATHPSGVGDAVCYRVEPFLHRHLLSLKWQEKFKPQDGFGKLLLKLKFPAGYLRWLWPAYKKAEELLSDGAYAGFITVSNPMGMQLIGLSLKRRFPGLSWVAEMRDPLVGYFRTRHMEFVNRRVERQIAQKADGIAEWVDFSPSPIIERHNHVADKHRHIAVVGYDPDEYARVTPAALEERTRQKTLSIVYTGGYYGEAEQWQGFFAALARMVRAGRPISFEHYGDWTAEQQRIRGLYKELDESVCTLHGRQSKQVCVEATQNADVLLYLLKESEENARRVSSKFYDYTAAGRPILSMAPKDSLLEERLTAYCPDLTLAASASVEEIERSFSLALETLFEMHNSDCLNTLLKPSQQSDLSCESGELAFMDLIARSIKH